MPAVYELFVLAKNSLSTAQLKTLMQNTGRIVLNAGDVTSNASVPREPTESNVSGDSASASGSSSTASTASSSSDGASHGVIMDVKYFGEQDLAYTIRRPGERHSSALVWQMTFGCQGSRLQEIERGLRLDEGVIRWSVLRRAYPYTDAARMSSYKVAARARELAAAARQE